MVKYLLIILLSHIGLAVKSQTVSAERIYSAAKKIQTARYNPDRRYKYLVLESSFSKEQIQKIPFTDRRIFRIDLVNTAFSESGDFDQKKLDLARMDGLIALNPLVSDNAFINWQIVQQTGCGSAEDCQGYFHGFVIYYEPYYTKETAAVEIDSINQDLGQFQQQILSLKDQLQISYTRINCEYPESIYSSEKVVEQLEKYFSCYEDFKGRVFFDINIDYGGRPKDVVVKGALFPCKEELAKAIKRSVQWKRGIVIGNRQFDIQAKGFVSFPLKKESFEIQSFEIPQELIQQYQMLQQYSQCVAYEQDTSYAAIIPKVEHKVVSRVLFRNQLNPDLIVADVTGSMYPFSADLLKWIRLAALPEETTFVFFNDGNDKPTEQKQLGNTGGLYGLKSRDFVEVRSKMFEAMHAGGGGDLPENNAEALLYGVNQLRASGEVVMIADNYSFPRDHELFARYTGRLRIILCHTEKGINTRYLDLARQYGFSIHTLNTDLTNLDQREVRIEGKLYRQSLDGFHEVY